MQVPSLPGHQVEEDSFTSGEERCVIGDRVEPIRYSVPLNMKMNGTKYGSYILHDDNNRPRVGGSGVGGGVPMVAYKIHGGDGTPRFGFKRGPQDFGGERR